MIRMKGLYIFFFTLLYLGISFPAFTQQEILVSGSVYSSADNSPLAGVNIVVKNTTLGTITKGDGTFELSVRLTLPITLRISFIGYATKEVPITQPVIRDLFVLLDESTVLGEDIVITAPLVEKKIFRSPVTIEKMDMLDLQQIPVSTFYDALATLRGVDVATQSLLFSSVNSRGFNSTENVRFVQLIDGIDNQAPGLNFPVGNIAGIPDLDIESVELRPGPSTTLFGPNALNGILLINSKDPFTYQGLTAEVNGMFNHLRFGTKSLLDFHLNTLYDASIRYARSVGEKMAFKINVTYTGGEDWHAESIENIHKTTDPEQLRILEEKKGYPEGTDPTIIDPGYDGLNVYGDEILTVLPIGSINRDIARTGYAEEDLVDYNTWNFKTSGAIHYKVTDQMQLIASGNYGIATTMYTGDNRISLRNFSIFQGKLELMSETFFVRAYNTWQNSGSSFDAGYLAVNLNRLVKDDEKWFQHYLVAYEGNPTYGLHGGDHEEARKFADSGFGKDCMERLEPGTKEFEYYKSNIINTADFNEGAKIINNSGLYHVEGMYDFVNEIKFVQVKVGANYRLYDLSSYGTLFADTTGNHITNYEYSVSSELAKSFFSEDLNLIAALRYDKNENFTSSFSPNVSLVYTLNDKHNFRISYQSASRAPNTKEQFINQDLGQARILGGLDGVINSYNLIDNSFFLADVEDFKNQVDIDSDPDNPEGYPVNQAIIKNLPVLEKGIVNRDQLSGFKPERVQSLELVYKLNIHSKIFLDATYYLSSYSNFIGLKRVVKPRTGPYVDLYDAATQILNNSQNDLYYVYSNAQDNVTIQGLTLGMKYVYLTNTIINSNFTWSKLVSKTNDPIVPGFNTPEYKFNLSFSQQNMYRYFSYNVNFRWQNKFAWQSPFGDGEIKGLSTLDMQGNYAFEKIRTVLKVGVSNFLNIGYVNNFGGPEIKSLYYINLNFNGILR